MANTNIDGTISTLFHGMDGFVSSKSVVGDPIKVGDTIIIPLLDVNFGMAAGAFNKQTGNNAAGGIGAKLSPAAVLVISMVRQDLLILRIRMPSARSLIWHLRSLTGSPASLRRKRQRKKSRSNRR